MATSSRRAIKRQREESFAGFRIMDECGSPHHNYLQCNKCSKVGILCDIPRCPCDRNGVLFIIDASRHLYAHQMFGRDKSVLIFANNPSDLHKIV